MHYLDLNGCCPDADNLNRALPEERPAAGCRSRLSRIRDVARTWIRRTRQRRELKRLNDRLLHDMGVARWQAREEWRKPFWRE